MSEHVIPAPIPHTGSTVRLARWVLAHRRVVRWWWLSLPRAGICGASHVSKRLSLNFSLPGQPGYETANKLKHLYGNGDSDPAVLLVTLPPGHAVAHEHARIANAFDRARASDPPARIVDYGSTHDPGFVTDG